MQESEELELIDAAIELAKSRFPHEDTCVAVLRNDKGQLLTDVWVEAMVDSACLCAETGAICEAHKLNERAIASICIYWEPEDD